MINSPTILIKSDLVNKLTESNIKYEFTKLLNKLIM